MAERRSSNYVRRRARPEASRRTREREQQIIEAGISIFAEKGYAEASTEEIGAAVGLLRGSLYYYIRSKEDLLYRILVDTHEAYLAQITEFREMPGDAMTRLRQLVRRHILTLDTRKRRLYRSELRHLSATRRREIAGMRDAYQDFVVELVTQAQAEGTCDPALDAGTVAVLILHNVNALGGVGITAEAERIAFAEMADRVLLRAVRPDPPTAP